MWVILVALLAGATATVKVQRELVGAGLRKELNTRVEVNVGTECDLVVHEKVTPDWFVKYPRP